METKTDDNNQTQEMKQEIKQEIKQEMKQEMKQEIKQENIKKYEDPFKDMKMEIKEDHFLSEAKEKNPKEQPTLEQNKTQLAKIIGHANNSSSGSIFKYLIPVAGFAFFSILNKKQPIQNSYIINDYYN